MYVARLHAPGDIRLAEEGRATAVDDHVLVRVEAVGICGSDLHWFQEGSIGDARLDHPLVLGHEISGAIETGPRAGERVAVDPAIPCWHCPSCRAGNPHLCLNIIFAGHGFTDGGLRQYLAWPADRLHPVPESFDAETTAMLEPLGVAIHAIDLAHIPLGGTVAVVGCGPIGLCAVQLARRVGAQTVIAADPLAHRSSMAAKLGADHVIVEADEALDGSADAVLEIAGTDSGVDRAIALARPGARVVLVGISEGDRTTFTASAARRKGLSLVMSRRMKEVYPRAIGLVQSGAVDLRSVVSDTFPLAGAVQAFRTAATRQGHKVIVRPNP